MVHGANKRMREGSQTARREFLWESGRAGGEEGRGWGGAGMMRGAEVWEERQGGISGNQLSDIYFTQWAESS